MDDTIAAYAAGLFDGEGCIRIRLNRPSGPRRTLGHVLQISIGMTDENVIRWLQSAFDFNFCRHNRASPRKPMFVATLHGQRAADFLRTVQPFVKVKSTQLILALEFQEGVTSFFKINGRKRIPDGEIARRQRLYEAVSALNGASKGRRFSSP